MESFHSVPSVFFEAVNVPAILPITYSAPLLYQARIRARVILQELARSNGRSPREEPVWPYYALITSLEFNYAR